MAIVQIVLLVLKGMGIVLLGLTGLLLLLLLLLLLFPIRYEVLVAGDGDVQDVRAKGSVTWLFRLVQIRFLYREGFLRGKGRIVLKKIMFGKSNKAEEREKEESFFTQEPFYEKKNETHREKPIIKHPEQTQDQKESNTGKTDEKTRAKKNFINEKIKQFFIKIKCTFSQIYDSIRVLIEKKNRLQRFREDPVHQKGFQVAVRAVLHFLKKSVPDKLQGKIVLGFAEPHTTGEVLALFSICYPFFGDRLEVTPDFEREIRKGRVEGKGKLRLFHVATLLVRLFSCSAVRKTYRDIRTLRRESGADSSLEERQ